MNKMTKCDFCTESNQKGRCFWSTTGGRRPHCEKAIQKMIEALKCKKSDK